MNDLRKIVVLCVVFLFGMSGYLLVSKTDQANQSLNNPQLGQEDLSKSAEGTIDNSFDLVQSVQESEKRTDLRSFQIQIKSFNPTDNKQELLETISDVRHIGQLINSDIYFVNSTGNISIFNLQTKKQKNLEIPDIFIDEVDYSQDRIITDFVVFDNQMFYIRGGCELYNAAIGSFSLINGQNKILLQNLKPVHPCSANSMLVLTGASDDKTKLHLWRVFGDAGLAGISLNEISPPAWQITQVASGRYWCEDVTNCTDEEEQQILSFEQLREQMDMEKFINNPQCYSHKKSLEAKLPEGLGAFIGCMGSELIFAGVKF